MDKINIEGKPKILFLDIETFPNIGYSWGKWEQNILEFIEHWYILSFSYKWFGSKTKVIALPDFSGYKPGGKDKKLVEYLWLLLDEADIICGQNCDIFDIKKINTRFIEWGLKPSSPYRTIDTLRVARRYFSFNSNKLDELGRDLNVGRKIEHEGFPLWLKCAKGDKKAWKRMKAYNRKDCDLLYEVYIKVRPWIKNHPNLDVWSPVKVCPKCGSFHIINKGYGISQTYVYQKYQCKSCGGWGQYVKGERKSYIKSI